MENTATTSAGATSAGNPQFDEWCIVELFGHQKMAGHVTQSPLGDMLRVDVHTDEDTILYTRFINPKAIYAINPVSQEVALLVGRQFAQPPVSHWELQDMLPKQPVATLPAARDNDHYDDGDDDYDPDFDEDYGLNF